MDTIKGIEAIRRAELLSKTGGSFAIAFFPYSRKKSVPDSIDMKVMSGCTCRTPLPHDRFDIDGKHFFLFLDKDQKPKTCYRVLIRYIGFSDEDFKLKKVVWYNE